MEIKYTIKVKDKHNPPVFDKANVLGKGVIATVVVNFKRAEEKDYLNSPMFQMQVYDQAKELLNDWFEVTFEKVEADKPKVKLSPFNKNLKKALKKS